MGGARSAGESAPHGNARREHELLHVPFLAPPLPRHLHRAVAVRAVEAGEHLRLLGEGAQRAEGAVALYTLLPARKLAEDGVRRRLPLGRLVRVVHRAERGRQLPLRRERQVPKVPPLRLEERHVAAEVAEVAARVPNVRRAVQTLEGETDDIRLGPRRREAEGVLGVSERDNVRAERVK